jgi:hypothetical protein
LFGIPDHRLEDVLKRLLGELSWFGLTDVRDGRRPGKLVVQLPPIVREIEPRDIVVGRHQIEIDDTLHAGCGVSDRFQQHPDRLFLEKEGRSLVGPDLGVLHLLLDSTRGPIEVLSPTADGLHEIGQAPEPFLAQLFLALGLVRRGLSGRHQIVLNRAGHGEDAGHPQSILLEEPATFYLATGQSVFSFSAG